MKNKGVLLYSLGLIIISVWLMYILLNKMLIQASITYMITVPVIFIGLFTGFAGVYYWWKYFK